MKQKEKILTILNDITKIDLDDFCYSLTINYENIINSFENKKVNITEIIDIINGFENKIKSFNLSFNNYGEYNEDRYKSYYYNVDFIFHSGGIVFNFTSKYLVNREIIISDIDKLINIYDEHKKSSKRLYDIISF
jgi:hypothetical protein